MTTEKRWTVADIPSQAGKRALITGGNSGIGFQTALELARAGAEVILPARTAAKAEEAANRIRRLVAGAQILTEVLDLADLSSIRAFVARLSSRFSGPSLDLLINNAGVMALPTRQLTVDGFERQFATNYLGPFALTALLFPAIRSQRGSRIVTVASGVANRAKIEFDNLQAERVYKPMSMAYSQSKLADLIFALELQRRLSEAGSPILSVAAHPGFAVTNLQAEHVPFGLKLMISLLKPWLSQDAAHGALPTLFAAVAPAVEPGGYYGPDGFQEMKGFPKLAKVPDSAKDGVVTARLWAESERLTCVPFGLLAPATSQRY